MFRHFHHHSRFIDTPRLSEAVRDRHHARNFGLDLVRAVAIILVIAEHTLPLHDGSPWRWLSPLLSPDATLFIVLSGALLLPVSRRTGSFLRRRAARVLIPFAFWSMIYAFLNFRFDHHNIEFLAQQIRWFWLNPVFPEGWFVPVIMGLYLLYPIITPWIRTANRRRFTYFLILWAAALSLPLLQPVMGVTDFSFTIVGTFFGFLGFAVAGVCFMRYPPLKDKSRRRASTALLLGLLLIGIVLPLVIMAIPRLDSAYATILPSGLSVTTAAASLLIFCLLATVKIKGHSYLRSAVTFISRISFLLYFIHPVLFRFVIPTWLPGLEGSAWVFPLTLVASIIIAVPVRAVPLLRKILA